MNLNADYLSAVAEMNADFSLPQPSAAELISCIDLTLLNENASDDALHHLAFQGTRQAVAAFCLFAQHLQKISQPAGINFATVINFPAGTQSTPSILSATSDLINSQKIDEIDYVFPYSTYLAGDHKLALEQCRQVYQLCKQAGLCFKVILETGALPSLNFIYQLSTEIINQGCDFLKTSTGKIPQGATPQAAFVILKAIKDSGIACGLKVSGGIKKPEQALLYANLAQSQLNRPINKSWFRIGASSLLDELRTF